MSETIDIAEGRRLLAAATDGAWEYGEQFKRWLYANAAALLDAASELADARQQLAECQRERNAIETDRNNLLNDRDELVNQNAALEKQLADAQSELAYARQQLAECQRERDNWKIESEHDCIDRHRSDEVLEQERNEHDKTRQQLADANAEIERLRAKYEPLPGICEHGIKEGDWCEPCNFEYKQAAKENDLGT